MFITVLYISENTLRPYYKKKNKLPVFEQLVAVYSECVLFWEREKIFKL
jgi:hypothetical protein